MTELTVLSLGAGVQSTALALMSAEGVLPHLDAAIFADTGWEPSNVYEHLDRLTAHLDGCGIPVYRVSSGNLRTDSLDPTHRFASIPYHIRNTDGTMAIGRRQCTKEYKLYPINRMVRALLGATPPDFKRVPKGGHVTQWIGFSADEVGRVAEHRPLSYVTKAYPLIDLGMDRKACVRWLNRRGWQVVKSACIGCPYHGNKGWRDLRDNRPDEWADAIAFDAAIRKGGARGEPLRGEAFLHRSGLPLAEAPIDVVGRRERKEWQLDIFDVLEEGDPDGCSPYGCRSGRPGSVVGP